LIVEPIQGMGDVKELRLVLTVSNFDAAVALYRDALVRVAFRVDDSDKAAKRLAAAGAERVADPATTPWNDRNARVRSPEGMQLTLFSTPE
jgi:uncharacterized glyoxalase superfamily protein PhnB